MEIKYIAVILLVSSLVLVSGITGFFVLKKTDTQEKFLVSKVIDGDTIELSDNQKVRLLGINTPESTEPHYESSKNRMMELVENKYVTFENGPKDKDIYGRLLRYVFVNNTFVNLQMLKEGHASVYFLDPDEKYYLEFKTAEKEAKDKKLGIWRLSGDSQCIVLVMINYDASGNDNNNLNDEYLTLKNNCKDQITMSGWEIKDSGTNIYKFKSFVLGSGSSFTLFSGKGTDTNSKIYWNSGGAIWNNAGDTLYLRDGKGNLVLSYTYP